MKNIISKLIIISFLLGPFVGWSQTQFLRKDLEYVRANLNSGWAFKENGKSNNGDPFITYIHKSGTEITLYFDNCINCQPKVNQVLIIEKFNTKSYYEKTFNEKYQKIGFLKWGDKTENIYIEMNLDMEYMDLLVINIKPLF